VRWFPWDPTIYHLMLQELELGLGKIIRAFIHSFIDHSSIDPFIHFPILSCHSSFYLSFHSFSHHQPHTGYTIRAGSTTYCRYTRRAGTHEHYTRQSLHRFGSCNVLTYVSCYSGGGVHLKLCV